MSAMRLSLAEQISQLEEAAPVELDPEAVQTSDAYERGVASVDPAAKEHYINVGPSALRKLHDSILDPKYDGVKTTRKRLLQEVSDDGVAGSEDEMVGNEIRGAVEGAGFRENALEGDQSVEGGENVISSGSDEENEEPPPASQNVLSNQSVPDDEPPDGLTSMLQKTRGEDRKKGRAISRQIVLRDTLLDARIRMQKSAVAANVFPVPSKLWTSLQSADHDDLVRGMMEEANALSNEIFELQEELLTSSESIRIPPRKRRKIQVEDTVDDYAACLDEAAHMVSAFEQSFHPHLVRTLSKWSSKIQAVAPSALLPSNKNVFLAKSSQQLRSAVQLVDETLADRDKLLARTQVRRGKYARIGEPIDVNKDLANDTEAFDDTDFYQQLLRDVIEARENGTDDWMTTQRQKKAKKAVDTKASKGRKIRYEIHEKLQNFMVPVPLDVWHEEQIDELFASVLGRGFENSIGHLSEEGQQRFELEKHLDDALKGGFRVFG